VVAVSPVDERAAIDKAKLAAYAERQKAKAEPKRAPEYWARQLGQLMQVKLLSGQRATVPRPKHAAADALHGWTLHAEQAPEHLIMTRADYEAALVAAARTVPCVDGRSHYVPFGPAASEYAPAVRAGVKAI